MEASRKTEAHNLTLSAKQRVFVMLGHKRMPRGQYKPRCLHLVSNPQPPACTHKRFGPLATHSPHQSVELP